MTPAVIATAAFALILALVIIAGAATPIVARLADRTPGQTVTGRLLCLVGRHHTRTFLLTSRPYLRHVAMCIRYGCRWSKTDDPTHP